MNTATEIETENAFTKQTVANLANGFEEIYEPSLQKTKEQLKELTDKQEVLINNIHDENLKIVCTMHAPEIHGVFNIVKLYQSKLVHLRKDLKALHEKSSRLKKRAVKLQNIVEKEVFLKNREREMEQKREEELIASKTTPQEQE